MRCPHCSSEIPDIVSICPNCNQEVDPEVPIGFDPPRAKDRPPQSIMQKTADFWLSLFNRTRKLHRRMADPEKPANIIPVSAFLLSLFFPGLGHLYSRAPLIGTVVIAIEAFLLLNTTNFRMIYLDSVMYYEVIYALTAIHAYYAAWSKSLRRMEQPGIGAWRILLLVITGLWLHTLIIYHILPSRPPPFRLMANQEYFAPVFRTGDLLDMRRIWRFNHAKLNDIVMINDYTLERVLGETDDILEIRDSRIFRNENPIEEPMTPLVKLGSQNFPYNYMRVPKHRTSQKIEVADGQIGFLFWGRELQVATMSGLIGQVAGIMEPEGRRCQFANGEKTPY